MESIIKKLIKESKKKEAKRKKKEEEKKKKKLAEEKKKKEDAKRKKYNEKLESDEIGCFKSIEQHKFNRKENITLSKCFDHATKNNILCGKIGNSRCEHVVYDSKKKTCLIPIHDDLTRLSMVDADDCKDSRYKLYYIPDSKSHNKIVGEIDINNQKISVLEQNIKRLQKKEKTLSYYNKALKNPNMNVTEVIEMERKKKAEEAAKKKLEDRIKMNKELQEKENYHRQLLEQYKKLLSDKNKTMNKETNIIDNNIDQLNHLNKNINTISNRIKNNNEVFDVNSNLQVFLKWATTFGIIILIGVVSVYQFRKTK